LNFYFFYFIFKINLFNIYLKLKSYFENNFRNKICEFFFIDFWKEIKIFKDDEKKIFIKKLENDKEEVKKFEIKFLELLKKFIFDIFQFKEEKIFEDKNIEKIINSTIKDCIEFLIGFELSETQTEIIFSKENDIFNPIFFNDISSETKELKIGEPIFPCLKTKYGKIIILTKGKVKIKIKGD
jgi:hypothetical protein